MVIYSHIANFYVRFIVWKSSILGAIFDPFLSGVYAPIGILCLLIAKGLDLGVKPMYTSH